MGKTYQSHISNSLIPSQISVIHLKNVLRVPSIASNLASVHQICQDNNCWCYLMKTSYLSRLWPWGKCSTRPRVKVGCIQSTLTKHLSFFFLLNSAIQFSKPLLAGFCGTLDLDILITKFLVYFFQIKLCLLISV